ncbi:MAG: T9SS C-terminal target domain-containing protein, partial [Flavobacteriia bacterium]|nr:T9SS C-terminal target domain-containing protein [Flavobacteriia bacterium]
ITDASAVPFVNADGQLVSNHNSLNAAIQQQGIVEVRAALPASRQAKLQRVYEFTCACSVNALSSALKEVNVVEGIENAPNYQVLATPNDYNLGYANNYALDLINAQGAWDITTGNSNIVLGISDQNISPNHSELVGKIVHYDASNMATPTHGNAVSILAAGNTNNNNGLSSIGYNSSIAFYQMDYNQIIAASYTGIRVINISWTSGCFYNQYEQDAMTEVHDNGTFIVAAAGNGNTCGTPDALVYPAAYAHVFAVTSIGESDNHEQWAGDPTSTHQHNQMVDLSAPGYGVAVAPADGWYINSSGTSYAAPMVTGTVGLMLAVNPCLSTANIEMILKNSSVDINALNPLYAGKIGAGRLNAAAAVAMAQGFVNEANFNATIQGLCVSSSATVTLNPSGAVAPYTVTWSNGMTGTQNSGLASGTYQLTLTDALGCTTDTTIFINAPTAVQVNAVSSNVQCFGQANGAIDVTVMQGTPAYTYSWDNGATTEDLTNLAPGTYRLVVVDGNGCSSITSYEITQPTEIVLSTSVVDVTANNNGSIDLSIEGGEPAYIIAWSNGAVTEDQQNIAAGTYNVTVFDANGCTASTQVVVNNNSVSGIEEQNNATMNVYPNPSNGASQVTWSGAMTEINVVDQNGRTIVQATIEGTNSYSLEGLSVGTYFVRLANAEGIAGTQRIVVL